MSHANGTKNLTVVMPERPDEIRWILNENHLIDCLMVSIIDSPLV
jgi:hypothetical protein